MQNIDRERAVDGGEPKKRGMFVTAQQFTDGDPEIFAGLFPSMHRLATRIVGERDAEDIVQEAWISASEKLSGELPQSVRELGGNVVPYVRKTVINAAKMHIRSNKRRIAREQKADLLSPSITKSKPSSIEEHATLNDLENVLRRNIPNQDSVSAFLLVERDGLSFEEAAERLGISFLRVKGGLQRVRPVAKALLEKYYEEV